MTNQLIALPTEKKELEAVFIEAQSLDPLIEQIRAQAASLPTDMTVKKNRDEVASFAYKIARSKTAVEKTGAALSAEYKEIPKKIDASRRHYRETFEALQNEVRGPLNEWEQAEKRRKDELDARFETLTRAATPPDETPLVELEQRLSDLEALQIDETWQEIEAEAHRARQSAINALKGRITRRAAIEQQQAENERLKAEAAAAEQIERAQQAQQAAEREKAEAVANAKASAQRAIEQAEKARLEEIAKTEAEQAARAADIEHRASINRAAAAALVANAGLTNDQARAVVIAIAQGSVPSTKIEY